MSLQQTILNLKKENPEATLKEMAHWAGTSVNTIRYHLDPQERERKLRVMRRRKDNVIRLKTERGGQCIICHYNKCLSALEFHHIEQHTKEGMVSRLAISGGSYEQAKREADKCVLLCANCHREVHDGVTNWSR